MSSAHLFAPLKLGRYTLSHRVVMAPLTRMRAAVPGNLPTELGAEYYSQRASAGGLIVTEASQVTPSGQGYPATPGIHSAEQIAGWKKITNAVHAKGGVIFMQLWHVGRVSHTSFQPDGALPVAPSAISPAGKSFTPSFQMVPFETPRALEIGEIPGIIEAYREGARNALAAGFDGVELHGANGYLIEQFLHSKANHRRDAYGGSVENRSRLLMDVMTALVDVWGADRVGVRLSPFGTFNDVGDADPIGLYSHILSRLAPLNIAYVHMIEARDTDAGEAGAPLAINDLRRFWSGTLILAGGFIGPSADAAIRAGQGDAVAFGRHFIANPDLPRRLQLGAALNPYNRATFAGGGAAGYTDYPVLQSAEAVE
ncbi:MULTISPECIES: alkene reductase [unclassified Bradyrhizobium]|uniref:alkene reductase n=1 Tax=unclassified Bradyrhizobium TaxID=2631580 RepID=UPI001FFAF41B|nr:MULTISPECIES: alkene reductase [unclassified Bradyrhizobium]MCK1715966.1 alkene reductase [Bradyrhizobium sp. 143]MCK1725764.1 alkene reductase [Bradyrhizobium sp. 142]